jgi:hypothetical protein
MATAGLGSAAAVLAALATTGGAQANGSVSVFAPTSQGVVAPSALHSNGVASPSLQSSRGVRSHAGNGAAARSAAGATAAAAASTPSYQLIHNWNGVSSLDSQLTNYNQTFEPPDQGLCEGNGFVLEAVNSAYRIWHTNGSPIEGPFNVNNLFNEGGQEFTSDPRCHYDASTNTWFATVLFISADSQSSHQDIAVSTTGDPTGLWTEYRVDTTDAGGNGCPCFGDQPRFGLDQYNLYLSTDEYSILGTQLNGGQLYAFSKADLLSGGPLHYFHYGNLSLGGTVPLAIEPSLSVTQPADAEYFLNAFDPNNTFDNRIGVWAMTSRGNVHGGVAPVLSAIVISSETYGAPVHAAQKGSSNYIDAGDDRMQQTWYDNGAVYGALTTAITIPGDSAERDGAAWFKVQPWISGGRIAGARIPAQGYVAKRGNYIVYPAIAASPSARVAMIFSETSSTRYPSAGIAVMAAGGSQFSAPIIVASGQGTYSETRPRWGDYSWALCDPVSHRFWMATEYMPPSSSWTTTGHNNWGTRVVEVSVS